VITKKWVEGKIDAHRKDNCQANESIYCGLLMILNAVGGKQDFCYGNHQIYSVPDISVFKKIDAICAYFGIEIVKEEKAEAIVARKIKRVKK
jgi:hypothetical protein